MEYQSRGGSRSYESQRGTRAGGSPQSGPRDANVTKANYPWEKVNQQHQEETRNPRAYVMLDTDNKMPTITLETQQRGQIAEVGGFAKSPDFRNKPPQDTFQTEGNMRMQFVDANVPAPKERNL